METFITGTNQKIKVHDKEQCKGQYCCIHNPSNHHMKDWPLHWRDDRRLMERICKCGVGHPDPDHIANLPEDKRQIADIHGCDGCDGCCGDDK